VRALRARHETSNEYACLVDTVGVLTLVGVVVALVVAFLALATYRRQFPKRQLRFALSLAPLLNLAHAGLEVTFKGQVVNDPQLATLWLNSSSRADIASSAFDKSDPIIFTFDQRVVGIASQKAQEIEWMVEGSELHIPPQLIRKGASLEISLVVEGKAGAEYDVRSSLVDIQLMESRGLAQGSTRLVTGLLIASSAMAVVVTGLIIWAFTLNLL